MRKTKKLTIEVANLNKEIANLKQVGIISIATTGGLFLIGGIASAVSHKSSKKDLEDLRETLLLLGETVTDHIDDECEDFDEEDEEEDDDDTGINGGDESPPQNIPDFKTDKIGKSNKEDEENEEEDIEVDCSLMHKVPGFEDESDLIEDDIISNNNINSSKKRVSFNNVEETTELRNLMEDLARLDLSDNKISKGLLRTMIDRYYKEETVSFIHCEPSYMVGDYIYGKDGLAFALVFSDSKILVSISETTVYCYSFKK